MQTREEEKAGLVFIYVVTLWTQLVMGQIMILMMRLKQKKSFIKHFLSLIPIYYKRKKIYASLLLVKNYVVYKKTMCVSLSICYILIQYFKKWGLRKQVTRIVITCFAKLRTNAEKYISFKRGNCHVFFCAARIWRWYRLINFQHLSSLHIDYTVSHT